MNLASHTLIISHDAFDHNFAMEGAAPRPQPHGARLPAGDTIHGPAQAFNLKTGALYHIEHEAVALGEEPQLRLTSTGETSSIHRRMEANTKHLTEQVGDHNKKLVKRLSARVWAVTGVSVAGMLALAAIAASSRQSTSRTTVVMMPPPRPPHHHHNNYNNDNNNYNNDNNW